MFDKHITKYDNIALMTYGRNTKKLFNLVPVGKNKTQLRNQIKHLNMRPIEINSLLYETVQTEMDDTRFMTNES